jgi:hypothetical protein
MNDQRKQILQMLSDGKINVDEAERLLEALGKNESAPTETEISEPGDGKKPKFLYVKVEGESEEHGGHENVNIKIPIVLLKAGIKLGSMMPEHARTKINSHLSEKGLNIDLNHIDPEHVDAILEALRESTIDIDSEHKKVKIYCA